MPFTIGKVFSDETASLLQRERESQRDNAARAYQLELQRREQMDKSKLARRELDLRARALDNDTSPEERQLRLEMARDELAGKREDRVLKREAVGADLQMSKSRLAGDAEERALRLRLGEGEIDARNRQITELEASGKFEREHKPKELNLRRIELGLKAERDAASIQQKKNELAERKRQIDELVKAGEFYRNTLKPQEWTFKKTEIESQIKQHQDRMANITRELALDERGVIERESAGKFYRDVEFPGTLYLKRRGVEDDEANTKLRAERQQTEADLGWRRLDLDEVRSAHDMQNADENTRLRAERQQTEADLGWRKQDLDEVKTAKDIELSESRVQLNQTMATKMLREANLDTFDAMTRRFNALVNNYKTATSIDNLNARKEAMDAAEQEVAAFLRVIKAASPAAHDQLIKQAGTDAASASGNAMFAPTGYGAAGVSLDNFIERFASGDKPPQLPKGR